LEAYNSVCMLVVGWFVYNDLLDVGILFFLFRKLSCFFGDLL
jgi:hypothetical protein